MVPNRVAVFKLRLLGSFSATLAGGDSQLLLSSRKSCALLAYTAMQPGLAASREVLTDLLWGGRCEEDARHSLRQCLTALKKEFEPVAPGLLKIDRQSVALKSELIDVDAHAADGFDVNDSDERMDEVVRLFRGDFLDRLEIKAEGFSHWVAAERQRLRGLRAQIYLSAAMRWDFDGEQDKAIDAAERLISLDPLREDWQRLIMRFYCTRHGRAHALTHARSVVTLLKRELDVEPEAETSTLIEQIKLGTIGQRHDERAELKFAEAMQPAK